MAKEFEDKDDFIPCRGMVFVVKDVERGRWIELRGEPEEEEEEEGEDDNEEGDDNKEEEEEEEEEEVGVVIG